jgi:hypothetical protein
LVLLRRFHTCLSYWMMSYHWRHNYFLCLKNGQSYNVQTLACKWQTIANRGVCL